MRVNLSYFFKHGISTHEKKSHRILYILGGGASLRGEGTTVIGRGRNTLRRPCVRPKPLLRCMGTACAVPDTSHQDDKQLCPPQHRAEPRTNSVKAEIQSRVEEKLREKERYLQIREAEIHNIMAYY